jgi:probable F420-dependent oxidoreductase
LACQKDSVKQAICKGVRMQLGQIGVWTSYRSLGEENAAEAARLVEHLGFGALWLGGSPQLPSVRPLLAATERLIVATGIVNVWQVDAATLAAQHAALAAEFPGRLLVGIGVGHPEVTAEYASPIETMRAYFDALDAAPSPLPPESRCAAALGERMLDLSRERSRGAHTYFVPVEHTRAARARLGPQALLAPELACVVGADGGRARAYAEFYLARRNYVRNLARFGFGEEDFADGGSQRLLDALVPQGGAEQIAERVHAHLGAGADHVCVQPVGVSGIPREEWTALASALLR